MYFNKLDDQEPKHIAKGLSAKFIHSEHMTMSYIRITKGSIAPKHKHETHEQITTVIEGEFELVINGESKVLSANEVAVIPPNTLHSGIAITDCYIIDTFNPPRDDFKAM